MPARGVLGEAIRTAREEIGMSQAELARRIGISKNAMNDIETGDTDPRASRITTMAFALDVSTDFLLGLGGYQRMKRDEHLVEYLCESLDITPPPLPPPPKRQRPRKAAPVS